MPRPKTKTEVATIKLTPQVRAAWEAAAGLERRSLANMFEVAILAYCEQRGVPVPDVAPPPVPALIKKARPAARKPTRTA
jgi:hypothetical protein